MTRSHPLFTCAAIAFLACSAKVDPGANPQPPDSGTDSNTGSDATTDPTDPRCEGFVPQTNHNPPAWCWAGDNRSCLWQCTVDSCSNECNAYGNHY